MENVMEETRDLYEENPIDPLPLLTLTIFFGYPIAVFYNTYLKDCTPKTKHLYFAITGLLLCMLNFGMNTVKNVMSVIMTYILYKFFHQHSYYPIINLLWNMSYLLGGYYFEQTRNYNINWTIPQCVMALKLIELGFNISDGRKLLKENKEKKLIKELPNIFELFGFCFFPPSVLIGPTFTFNRYRSFINNEFDKYEGNVRCGLKRFFLGFIYLLVWAIGENLINQNNLLEPKFKQLDLYLKVIILALWFRIAMAKYIAAWLVTEGALMCFGITYNNSEEINEDDGNDRQNDLMWNACANIDLHLYESTTTFEGYIRAFNITTNKFFATYISKRINFVQNRNIIIIITLVFLSLWHGLHTGYFITFILEFLVIKYEKQQIKFKETYKNSKPFTLLNNKFMKAFISIVFKIYHNAVMGFCLGPFVHLTADRWLIFFENLDYFLIYLIGYWFAFYIIFNKIVEIKNKYYGKDILLDKDKTD